MTLGFDASNGAITGDVHPLSAANDDTDQHAGRAELVAEDSDRRALAFSPTAVALVTATANEH